MSHDYQRAFALRDNPFGPTRPFGGIRPNYLAMLQTKPLRVWEEPKLLDLFSEAAGPYKRHLDVFRSRIRAYGYDPQTHALGLNSLIFGIVGQKGTGKTTLANVMVYRLLQCASEENEWKMYPAVDVARQEAASSQTEEISKLKEKINAETQQGDYCCLVIDDLRMGADRPALQLFDDLVESERIVAMFLVTSDEALRKKSWANSKYDIEIFRTQPLVPSNAVKFVHHRITRFREPVLANLSDYQVFPFDGNDIQQVLEQTIVNPQNGNTVTIRQLNCMLHRSLVDRLGKLKSGFDIAQLSQEVVEKHVIYLRQSYEELLK